MRSGPSGIRLPQALRDEISKLPDSDPVHRRKRSSRKETRKLARVSAKQRKAGYFNATTTRKPQEKQRVEMGEDQPSALKRRKLDHGSKSVSHVPTSSKSMSRSTPTSSLSETQLTSSAKPKKRTGFSHSAPNPDIPVKTIMERDEDAYIAHLESKLGRHQGKLNDGLEDLLEFVSSIGGAAEPREVSGTGIRSESGSSADEDEWQGCVVSSLEHAEPPTSQGLLHTSTHVPKIVLADQSASRYVPPHLRDTPAPSKESSELQSKLNKKLMGLLNRMSEDNIGTIVDGIEETYASFKKHDVTSTLTTLILAIIASPNAHLESHMLLYAALVASVGQMSYSSGFVPHFLQKSVATYQNFLSQRDSAFNTTEIAEVQSQVQPEPVIQGKQAANLLHLFTAMYNLRIISCELIFDMVRELLEGKRAEGEGSDHELVHENAVELILIIVRDSGPQLRSDDSNALKDIVQLVEEKMASYPANVINSRTRFMIETLVSLKNNKLKGAANSHSTGPRLERMKKFLNGLFKKRNAHHTEPLRLSLADLLSVENRGKWWIAGVGWSGKPLTNRHTTVVEEQSDEHDWLTEDRDDALEKLARKQGMNTDIRRAIFSVLMGSDDYVDACERLTALGLTEVQQREIVRVLLHCCGNETTYNPYYTLVCQRLCHSSHSYKITLQFYLWDFMRELGETKVGGMELIKNLKDDSSIEPNNVSARRANNVARAYGWWIAKGCINLTILKPVDFTTSRELSRSFLKELLQQVLVSTQVAAPVIGDPAPPTKYNLKAVEQVFIRATQIEPLAIGLVSFLEREFRGEKGEGLGKLVDRAKETLRTGVEV